MRLYLNCHAQTILILRAFTSRTPCHGSYLVKPITVFSPMSVEKNSVQQPHTNVHIPFEEGSETHPLPTYWSTLCNPLYEFKWHHCCSISVYTTTVVCRASMESLLLGSRISNTKTQYIQLLLRLIKQEVNILLRQKIYIHSEITKE